MRAIPLYRREVNPITQLTTLLARPPTGEISLPYSYVQGQFGNIDSDDVVTKAIIRVANAVSEGAIVNPGYRPSLITYSYEHPLHAEWEAERSFDLPKNDEGKPVIDVLKYSPTLGLSNTTGWAASTGTIRSVLEGGDPTAYVYNTGSSGSEWLTAYPTIARNFIGLEIIFEALLGDYDLTLTAEFFAASIRKYSVIFDLETLKGKGKVQARFIAPTPVLATVNEAQAVFDFFGNPAVRGIKVYELRALESDTTLLEQIARAQIRLPAREVTQITCARGLGDGSGQTYGGFLLEEIGKAITLTGAPEPITGTIAEVIDTFTTTEGMLSRISTGNALRSPEVRAIQQYLSSV